MEEKVASQEELEEAVEFGFELPGLTRWAGDYKWQIGQARIEKRAKGLEYKNLLGLLGEQVKEIRAAIRKIDTKYGGKKGSVGEYRDDLKRSLRESKLVLAEEQHIVR